MIYLNGFCTYTSYAALLNEINKARNLEVGVLMRIKKLCVENGVWKKNVQFRWLYVTNTMHQK